MLSEWEFESNDGICRVGWLLPPGSRLRSPRRVRLLPTVQRRVHTVQLLRLPAVEVEPPDAGEELLAEDRPVGAEERPAAPVIALSPHLTLIVQSEAHPSLGLPGTPPRGRHRNPPPCPRRRSPCPERSGRRGSQLRVHLQKLRLLHKCYTR